MTLTNIGNKKKTFGVSMQYSHGFS